MTEHLSPETLVDFLRGELSPAADAAAHAHLADCAACRELRARETTLVERLRAVVRADRRELPPQVVANVRAAIRGPVQRSWARSLLSPGALALPLAAAVALAFFLGDPFGRAPGPTIDALYYLQAHADQSLAVPLAERGATAALNLSMNEAAQSAPEAIAAAGAAGASDANLAVIDAMP
ncbi:MAG: zf-HC2 domain-containing protein [Vulcanimicrobiaceae bacterium]